MPSIRRLGPSILAALLAAGPFAALAPAQDASDVFDRIEAQWGREDAGSIARSFDDDVTIQLGSREPDRVPRDLAARWLQEYFDSVEVREFEVERIDGLQALFRQVAVDARGNRRTRRIAISLVNDGGLRISSIRQ